MDGYSVEQAAEVLGIPQGRVWELIARGVLAGATEGGTSMRVYLKPATMPSPVESGTSGAANGERLRTNGESHGELSPFRELLTEFRNLTERYGQALLALGEARGEVAALRGRVDLLEARMEMRLPVRPASTVAWEMPGYAPPPAATKDDGPQEAQPAADEARAPAAAEVAMTEPPRPDQVADEDAAPAGPLSEAPAPEPAPSHPDSGRRRASGGHAAVAGLAEALARAEDPALLNLPGAREAAEAFAALQRQTDDAAQEAPTEEPPTEEAAAEMTSPEMTSPESDALAAYAPTIELADEEEPTPVAEEASAEVAPAEAPSLAADEPAAEPEPAAYAYPPDSPYTTEVVEPDWFADGDFAWPDPSEPDGADQPSASPPQAPAAVQEPAQPDAEAEHLEAEQERPAATAIQEAFEEPEPETPPVPGVQPTAGFGLFRGQPEPAVPMDAPPTEPPRATRDEEALMWLGDEFEAAGLEIAAPGWQSEGAAGEEGTPTLQLSEAEIEQLAATEGWDRAEIDAIRDLVGRHADATPAPEPPAQPQAEDPQAEVQPDVEPAGRFLAGNAPALPPTARQSPAERIPWIASDSGDTVDPDWLRGRRGPAADAYRRLRRLFQS